MTEFPKYPNIDAVLGTSLPIVTSLMAAVSGAILAVPLARTLDPQHPEGTFVHCLGARLR